MGHYRLLRSIFASKPFTHNFIKTRSFPAGHQCYERLCSNSSELESKSESVEVLVYEGPLRGRIKAVKILSLSSSAFGVSLLPVLLQDFSQTSIIVILAAGFMSSAFVVTPLLLNWITKRYVLELHYDTKSRLFTAKTFNLLSQVKETRFSANDVFVPDMPGMLSSFEVHKKPLFVDANIVREPDAYSHMMGYDKPLDLRLDLKENDKDSS